MAAIDAAQQAGPAQVDGTQVLVQRLDSTYRILWTFGEDPLAWPGVNSCALAAAIGRATSTAALNKTFFMLAFPRKGDGTSTVARRAALRGEQPGRALARSL